MLVLFGVPNEQAERNDWELSVPRLGSLILTHSWDGQIEANTDLAPEDRPPVAIPFYAFRIMVGLGVLMLASAWWGLIQWRRGTLVDSRWYLRSWIWMMPSGFIALLAGWWVAEAGRQPWVVYGLLRTADAVSDVPAGSVLASLVIYVVVYVLLDGFVLGIGTLTLFADDDAQRALMMNTAAPICDGNETWLIMGGAGLMAAFPKAYAVVLSTLYLPVLFMLIALIFRGVAGAVAALRAGRRPHHAARRAGVHGVLVPRVSRQGHRRERVLLICPGGAAGHALG